MSDDETGIDLPDDIEIDEPTEATTSPYESRRVINGEGFHDPEAIKLDKLSADDESLEGDEAGDEVEGDDDGTMRTLIAKAVIRMGAAVVAWVLGRTRWSSGYCQQFARSAFGVGAYYGSARLAWLNAKYKHRTSSTGNIPKGVPVFWLGGSHGYGHVAISLGNGLCRSTDWPSRGRVGTARISDIHIHWGLSFQGWTEDINRVRIYTGSSGPKRTTLDASTIAEKARDHKDAFHGALLKKAVAAEVGQGDMNLRNAVLGSGFREQYRKVQEKYLRAHGEKPTAKTADGIPGPASLRWLGSRHGFDVRA